MNIKRTNTLLHQKEQLNLCIDALNIPPKSRQQPALKQISSYLKTLPQFMQLIEVEFTNLTKKFLSLYLKEIASRLTYQSLQKNRLLMRYGQKGTSYFVILSGKVGFLTVKNQNFYLNEEEYILHLIKLRQHNEMELLRNCINLNQSIVIIEEDFDSLLTKILSLHNSSSNNNKQYSQHLIKKVQETIDWLTQNKKITNEINDYPVTITEYLQWTSLEDPSLPNQNRFLLTIPIYEHLNTFGIGATFGYIALEQKHLKRTASAITLDDCNFSILSKEDYIDLLKEVNTKARHKFFSIIYSYNLFNSITKRSFELKYFNMFTFDKIERNQKILSETEECKFNYFIQKGQFELIVNGNLIEINQLIIKLKNKLKMNTATEEKNLFDLINNKFFRSPAENKILLDKANVTVAIIKDRDIIGLNDTLDDSNGFGLFTCQCTSFKGEVFMIKTDAYNHILKKEDNVNEENDVFIKDKTKYYIDRLRQHHKITMSLLKKYNDDNTKESYRIDKEILKEKQINKNRFTSFDSNITINQKLMNKYNDYKDKHDDKKKKKVLLPLLVLDNPYQEKPSYEKRLEKLLSLQGNKEHTTILTTKSSKSKMNSMSIDQTLEKEVRNIMTQNRYINTLNSCLVRNKKEAKIKSNKLIKSQNNNKITNYETDNKGFGSKVHYVDCLIMERFNYLYTRVQSPLHMINK